MRLPTVGWKTIVQFSLVVGSGLAIFLLGMDAIWHINETYDTVCVVQSSRGPCEMIGGDLNMLEGCVWLATITVPLAFAKAFEILNRRH